MHKESHKRERHSGDTSQCDPEHIKTIANAINAPVGEFQMQLEDILPRAIHESSTLHKNTDSNKSGWSEAVRKVNVHRSVKANHPTNFLVDGLVLHHVFGISSSGVEHNFSKSDYGYSNRRQHAHPDTEEFCLKVFLDLPHHNKENVIAQARKIWVILYGSCRNQTSNCNAGVPKCQANKQVVSDHMQIGGPIMAESETAFIHKRRSAIAEQACITNVKPNISVDHLMQDAGDHGELDQWTEAHDKELAFQHRKLHARKIQAVAEGTMEGDDALHHDVRNVKAKRLKDQQARVRKATRDNATLAGITLTQLCNDMYGKLVHIDVAVPSSYQLGLEAAIQRMGLQVVAKHQADVFVVVLPGTASKSIMLTSALRGSYHISPEILTSNFREGVALKWHEVAHIPRIIFVSSGCYAAQKNGIDYVQSVVQSVASNKIEIKFGDWESLRQHIATHARTPARVIALVNSDELKHPVGLSVVPRIKSVVECVS